MFFKTLLLGLVLVATASASRCSGGSNVPHDQPCSCADHCMGNSQCLRDGQGGSKCQCLPCEYFDDVFEECVPTPDYGDPCNSVCSSNLECLDDGAGGKTCQCPPPQNYLSAENKCTDAPGWLEPCTDLCQPGFECRDDDEIEGGKSCQCEEGIYDVEAGTCGGVCFSNVENNACKGKANGDYPLCMTGCRQGRYVTCSNEYIYVRDCPNGWYTTTDDGPVIPEKKVFDPSSNSCQRKVDYCPRELDNHVFG